MHGRLRRAAGAVQADASWALCGFGSRYTNNGHEHVVVRSSGAELQICARELERPRLVRVEDEARIDCHCVRASRLEQHGVRRIHVERLGVDFHRIAAVKSCALGREHEPVRREQRRLAIGLCPLGTARVANVAEGLG